MKDKKQKRLELVARLYYEQNRTQAEIAKEMKVSRPLISRMLEEARQEGIVEIRVHSKSHGDSLLLNTLKEKFGISGGYLVADGQNNNETNQLVGNAALELVQELGGGRIGIGWGNVVGSIVSELEKSSPRKMGITHVSPMVGNSSASIRHYHPNENTRIIAQQTLAKAHYLYTPAFAETKQELELMAQTEQYKSMLREWAQLDIALVNIGVHPSTPDFASGARFGNLLSKHQAVGRLIAYYYTIKGEIIASDQDYAMQIPLEILASCKNVVGICSAGVSPKALMGALNTKRLTQIVVSKSLVEDILKE